ncbi:7-carboxy-7-deazaguanine synthase QueE [Rubritalea marina]|uniref:7-carboxy-7-deazaguanine synthase QueE n=1 Tax=Rubritalea marina TaxID=361055 RepID=UPI0006842797|nr:7-carboxy-7-deazaguanine synthase QueE [Rubritalea marina]
MSEKTIKLAVLNGEPEIFHTIQGEGVSMGVPSIFIRASLCNLHCKWCDTDYTWNWKGTPWPHEHDSDPAYQKFDKQDFLTEIATSEVASLVAQFPCRNIILTGGEPLLQQDAWIDLIQKLRAVDTQYRFEVETNGTQVPQQAFASLIDQFNVSPKLENSGNALGLRDKPEAMAYYAGQDRTWFKFVISETSDLQEVLALVQQYHIPHDKVLLMPEGRDDQTLQQKRLWLADYCRDHGFRYSDRLHIQLWGSKRGV